MDYCGCDADGMLCSYPESLPRSKNEISNWNFGGILFGVQDSSRKQLLLGGTNPIALAAEDWVAGSEIGGISDSRSPDKYGSWQNQRSALPLMSSSSELSSKRLRRGRVWGGANLRNARCQVYGCNKDLASCKDYHKRHKVCEVHTKTSKVTVNGIEQRFCQQCSRFHLLAEFDDGKRSCRKRLAGHNARRRKPRPSLHSSGGSRKMLLPHYGTEYSMDACLMPSFICQDMLPSHNMISFTRFGKTNGFGVLKQEQGLNCEAESVIGFLPSIPCRGFDELAFDNGGEFSATGSQFRQQPNPVLQLLLREDKTLLQSDGVSMVDSSAWTTDQAVPGIPKSARAQSLLSSQSQTCSDHASGFPVDRSSFVNNSESPCMTRTSMVINKQAVANGLLGVFCLPAEVTRF